MAARLRYLVALLTFAIGALGPAHPAGAHGGGLDGFGCHHDRKAGGYHCHRGPLAGRSFASKAEAAEAISGASARAVAPRQSPSAARSAAPSTGTAGNPSTRVWVNTDSGVYHCPGTRWYGATKEGTYMAQAEAKRRGYRPGYGRLCR